MRLDVYVPMLAALLLGAGVGPLSRLWVPHAAARILVGAGVISAGCWVWALGLLGWTAVGQVPLIARYGGWSVTVLQGADPVSPAVAYAAVGMLLALTVLLAVSAVRRTRAVVRSWTLARRLAPAANGELIVVPDEAVDAFALPAFRRPAGRRAVTRAGSGHIVVTTGMLQALGPDERRVVFAHERAHLHGHDHWWLLAAQLAAAANPLLTRLPGTVDYLLERAADEHAATAVRDRGLAARALARAGLAASRAPGRPSHGLALGYGATAVTARVAALLEAPPRSRRAALVGVGLALVFVLCCAVDAGRDVEHLFELAMYARH
ncbi:M48 family metalloprotease [Pseudonocardia sp. RS11V-5]|uniref:M48 family metalloprotease n=1 Tax=Pseudonocardia terrae TaxID=2905831 RepID=UPI001E2EA4E8|nr:M48 family metalloprotease [Pseudonocardia terrae]MCE3551373.1 M48 family metalloprotease [Pseudonocardia terrae]